MANKNLYQKLGYRISEEIQLLAEEKWILEALAKIKKQRNCLQIERLHLESLKANIKGIKRDISVATKTEEPIATTSAVNLMQSVTTGKTDSVDSQSETTCNYEELNLMVTQPVFSKNLAQSDYSMDEEESDDDMFIDMNMLMNGVTK